MKLERTVVEVSQLEAVGKSAWCESCRTWFLPVNPAAGRCTHQLCPGCGETKPLEAVQ